ncbi:VOC family protein [Helcobacillus massiliensis]|uniref:VOC family protein n=1 Tax=Helcobacillus massiliensis TaxID=521392 RepID=A0A839R1D3_9MICO|nr:MULTISPECIES: VOC family protein [Helcobacillus]MBB3023707.1 hypothetical protein [Helcobacillus massiliensis]MCG7427227.1 VOC family protein [Helcobacillus sp. ACRRO]MCT1556842.1 VOC family protein [Helcobacillus massiliensis]MCT2035666.1 VOC family protein [Helcobacillus massiliensis]MCT2330882.1 VOC family protein [Helcobacillus massiliensis]
MTHLSPIRFTAAPAAVADFYTLLGLREYTAEASDGWRPMLGGPQPGRLNIHHADEARGDAHLHAVDLHLDTDEGESLEALHRALQDAGHEPGPIIDETFGRFFRAVDPDGYTVQVNDTDHELQSRQYTLGQ